MSRQAVWILALASCWALTPLESRAADDGEAGLGGIEAKGPYLGISGSVVGLTSTDDLGPGELGFNRSGATSTDVQDSTGFGFGLRGGTRVSRWVGAEVEGDWTYHDMQVDVVSPLGMTTESLRGLTSVLTGGARLYFAHWANAEFYAGGGFGVMVDELVEEGSKTAAALRFGTGVEIYFSERMGATLGATYVLPTGNLRELDYLGGQFGLFYRFAE